jgi:hypothetical protein
MHSGMQKLMVVYPYQKEKLKVDSTGNYDSLF